MNLNKYIKDYRNLSEIIRIDLNDLYDVCLFIVKQINKMKESDVGHVANSIRSAFLQLNRDGEQSVNAALNLIDFAQANDFHLVGVLRALRPARHKLGNWKYALTQCRRLLASKDLDADSILEGLNA